MRATRQRVLAGACAAALTLAAGHAGATTLTFENPPRLGSVKLGSAHPRLAGFTGTTIGPGYGGSGCVFGPPSVWRFEDYRSGARLGFYSEGRYVGDIALSRPGARAAGGLVIGRATFLKARSRLRGARVISVGGIPAEFRLGSRALATSRRVGYEASQVYMWWFDSSGRLSGAEAYISAC